MAEAGLPLEKQPEDVEPAAPARPSKEFPIMAKMPKPEEMIASRASFPEKSWMDVKTEIKAGMYAYPAKVDIMEGLHMPHPHAWQPEEEIGTCPKTGKKSSIRP